MSCLNMDPEASRNATGQGTTGLPKYGYHNGRVGTLKELESSDSEQPSIRGHAGVTAGTGQR
jgi:hypothetical protein